MAYLTISEEYLGEWAGEYIEENRVRMDPDGARGPRSVLVELRAHLARWWDVDDEDAIGTIEGDDETPIDWEQEQE